MFIFIINLFHLCRRLQAIATPGITYHSRLFRLFFFKDAVIAILVKKRIARIAHDPDRSWLHRDVELERSTIRTGESVNHNLFM